MITLAQFVQCFAVALVAGSAGAAMTYWLAWPRPRGVFPPPFKVPLPTIKPGSIVLSELGAMPREKFDALQRQDADQKPEANAPRIDHRQQLS